MVDDDLAELEAAQKAKAQRRRRNVLIALYVAGWYIVLMLTAVEFLLRDGSGPSILLGWLGVLPAWITMIGWTAAYVTDRIIEDEERERQAEIQARMREQKRFAEDQKRWGL